MIPTPIQAQVLWLNATGMTTSQIARELGITSGSVSVALTTAKKKAIAAGLRITVTKAETGPASESGFSFLKRLAVEAGISKKPTK